MAFGDVVRTATPPTNDPSGIGGNEDVIWHSEFANDNIYELSPADFSTVRSSSGDSGSIGGDLDVIWQGRTSDIVELSTSDLSLIRSGGPQNVVGVGGTSNKIWGCENGNKTVFEASPSDFSVLQSSDSFENVDDVGGDDNTIWFYTSDFTSTTLRQLSPSDFSVVESVNGVDTDALGGSTSVIWGSDDANTELEEFETPITIPAAPTNLSATLQ